MPYVTFADRQLKKEGRIEGRHEAIEAVLQVRFLDSAVELMPQVKRVEDLDKLHELLQVAKTADLTTIKTAITTVISGQK